jgi:hypothetical protein
MPNIILGSLLAKDDVVISILSIITTFPYGFQGVSAFFTQK